MKLDSKKKQALQKFLLNPFLKGPCSELQNQQTHAGLHLSCHDNKLQNSSEDKENQEEVIISVILGQNVVNKKDSTFTVGLFFPPKQIIVTTVFNKNTIEQMPYLFQLKLALRKVLS